MQLVTIFYFILPIFGRNLKTYGIMPGVRNVGAAGPPSKRGPATLCVVKMEMAFLTAQNAQNAEGRFRSVFAIPVIFVVKQFSRLPISGLRIGSDDGEMLRPCLNHYNFYRISMSAKVQNEKKRRSKMRKTL